MTENDLIFLIHFMGTKNATIEQFIILFEVDHVLPMMKKIVINQPELMYGYNNVLILKVIELVELKKLELKDRNAYLDEIKNYTNGNINSEKSSSITLPKVGRYVFFYKNHNGDSWLIDRHDNKIVQDLTHEYAGHCSIIEKQWNDDFDLYTDEVLQYVLGNEQYWSYDHLLWN